MKKKTYLLTLLLFGVLAVGCKDDKLGVYPVPDKGPDITGLVVQNDASDLQVPGEMSYSLKISDKYTLSTLDVSVDMGGIELASQRSIIYKSGNSYTVDNEKLEIPFLPGMPDGAPVTVKFLAISVPGGETMESVTLNLKRPAIGKLFMFLGNADTGVEMIRDPGNGNLFTVKNGDGALFPTTFEVKFADNEKLDDASLIWVGAGNTSAGTIGAADDEGIKGYFPTTLVETIKFDVMSFELGVEGDQMEYAINGTPLLPADASLSGGLLYARVNLTQGQAVSVLGLTAEELEMAYNRDFFSYFNGTVTFLRDSGDWDVYYSTEYNYFWIRRDSDVGPEGFWVVGHGFFAVPTKDDLIADYDGWTTDDVIFTNYIVKTGENKYQTTMYVVDDHKWGFEFQFYSDFNWGKAAGIDILSLADLSGDTAGFGVSDPDYGLVQGADFTGGYFRFEFDLSGANAACRITRLDGDVPDPVTNLDITGWTYNAGGPYYETKYTFEPGKAYRFTGADIDMAKAYNRDFFTYDEINDQATFNCAQREWTVRYYPDYEYIWVYDLVATYPVCLWVAGQGICSAPVFNDEICINWSLAIPNVACVPMVGPNLYQMTVYCGPNDPEESLMISIYRDRGWGEDIAVLSDDSLTGPAASNFIVDDPDVDASNIRYSADGYAEGYYTFLFDLSVSGKTTVTITAAN